MNKKKSYPATFYSAGYDKTQYFQVESWEFKVESYYNKLSLFCNSKYNKFVPISPF